MGFFYRTEGEFMQATSDKGSRETNAGNRTGREKGYLALVLHGHLPYVRHPEHDQFLEEDWLYEAITETYIPLINVFDGLVERRRRFPPHHEPDADADLHAHRPAAADSAMSGISAN